MPLCVKVPAPIPMIKKIPPLLLILLINYLAKTTANNLINAGTQMLTKI